VVKRSKEMHQRTYRSVVGELLIERYVYCRREKIPKHWPSRWIKNSAYPPMKSLTSSKTGWEI
jgi:hypothetical protein